jgi:hypothetical protein
MIGRARLQNCLAKGMFPFFSSSIAHSTRVSNLISLRKLTASDCAIFCKTTPVAFECCAFFHERRFDGWGIIGFAKLRMGMEMEKVYLRILYENEHNKFILI